MESKTIKISKENYLWLLKMAAELQMESHRPITFDRVIDNIKKRRMKKKKSIMDFAGIWRDMADEEADEIKNNIKKLRKKSTKDLLKNDIFRF